MENAIDVIVPTYGRSSCIQQCVDSILPQLEGKDNLFIIWQGKQKPNIRESKQCRLLHSSPPNLPVARNKGVLAGTSDIILFFDDDVVVNPGVLRCHRNAYIDMSIGAIAGKILDPLFPQGQTRPASFDEKTGNLVQSFNVDQSQFSISLMGAHMSFKREALLQIGKFDPNFTRNALWEEVDVAFRLRQSGYTIWYCAEAVVNHRRQLDGGCRSDSARQYLFHQFANTAYFSARHANRKYVKSWLQFWMYRLEYETRGHGVLKHSPAKVASALLGAFCGLLRYWIKGRT